MAVSDRWHKSRPGPGESPCREHKMAPAAGHGEGERWQVRWRDEQGRQRKQSYARKTDADAADARIRTQVNDGTYVDQAAGKITFRAYAEDWRRTRMHDQATAERIESGLRVHAYSAEGTPGVTATGGPAIGDYPLRVLAKRTQLLQGWIKGLRLNPSSARTVITYANQVFGAAADEGIIARNPLSAKSVQKPALVKTEAIPWSLAEIEDVAAALPPWLAAIAYLGAATGMRQGELFALALPDLDFLRMSVRVEAQIKRVGGRHCFAPIKNKKARDVPVDEGVIPVLSEHVRRFPPVEVTLPWHDPRDPRRHGQLVTRKLVFTRPTGVRHLEREAANRPWRAAWKAAGIPDRGRLNGMHVLRHTAASVWLSEGVGLAEVAMHLGDTQEVVLSTYSHFMPDKEGRARAAMRAFFAPAKVPSAPDVPRTAR